MRERDPGLKEPVVLMTDDVLAECDASVIIFKALGESEASTAAPVGSNLHFQGHLHCRPPSEEVLNQSPINRGSAAERRHGKRGRKKQSLLYLDL